MAVKENLLIKTNLLCLRPLRLDDLPSVQRIGGHPLMVQMLASIGTPWPKAAVQAWITARQYRRKSGFCAASVLPERAVIGVARLAPNSVDGPCSCAHFIDPWHWGLGYASEAIGAVLRKLAFQELGKGSGKSQARLEPAPVTLYRLRLDDLKAVL